MTTNNLLAGQIPLFGQPGTAQDAPDVSIIEKQQTLHAAIKLCIQYAGFGYDKEIYKPLGIDAGNWTRIMNGDASFPENKLLRLMELCGNEIPLQWLASKRGYRLLPCEDAKDKRIRDLEKANEDQRKEIETLVKYGVLTRGAK